MPRKIISKTIIIVILLFGLVTGVVAQEGTLFVSLVKVDSRSFPDVTAFLAVSDEGGVVNDLSPDDLQLSVEGEEISAASFDLEPTTFEDLRLVLALDLSVPEGDLAEIKESAIALLDSLGPRDKVAIFIFADEVEMIHDFTNNIEELTTLIEELTPQGSFTALHEAMITTTAVAEAVPEGRKGVIVISDKRDNTDTAPSLEETISRIQESGIPVYLIGFGDDRQSSSFADPPDLAGGEYFNLIDTGQVETTLLDIEESLRQGYAISFISQLEADDESHPLTVIVGETEVTGEFVARADEIEITIPELNQRPILFEGLTLTSQVVAPAPIVSVEYWLDDQLLSQVESPPYRLEWERPQTESGTHTFRARVRDTVGNRGETQMEVTIADPLAIEISPPASGAKFNFEEQIGLSVAIDFEPTAPLTEVEWLLDDVLIESKIINNDTSLGLMLDSQNYQPGSHLITVRVKDDLGRVAEDTLEVEFLEPTVSLGWLDYLVKIITALLALGVILVIVLLTIILLRYITTLHRRRCRKQLQLQLANLGNIGGSYFLRVKEQAKQLEFQFVQDGIELGQRSIAAFSGSQGEAPLVGAMPSQTVPHSRPPSPPPSSSPSQPSASPPAQSQAPRSISDSESDDQESSGMRESLNRAGNVAGQVQGCAGFFSNIFLTLGDILPGSMGRSVKGMGQRIVSTQSAGQRIAASPRRVVTNVGRLRDQVGSRIPARNSGGQSEPNPESERESTDIYPQEDGRSRPVREEESAPSPPPQTRMADSRGSRRIVSYNNGDQRRQVEKWSETPFVDSGEEITVNLVITPMDPYRRERYPFTIDSKLADQGDSMSEQSEVQIEPIRGSYRFVLRFLVILIAAWLIVIVSVLAYYLISIHLLKLTGLT